MSTGSNLNVGGRERLIYKGKNGGFYYLTDSGKKSYLSASQRAKFELQMMDIFEAVMQHNYEVLERLLQKGVDINSLNNNGGSPLYVALTVNQNNKMIEFLIKKGADVNQSVNGEPLLIRATRFKLIDPMILLLENGADPNVKDAFGNTALMYSPTLEILKLLLEYGSDPFVKNNDGITTYDKCPTRECKSVVAEYIWKRMDDNVKKLSTQFSKSGNFQLPKEVWRLILLRKKRAQLCKLLRQEKNQEILYYFAMSLEISVTKDMTKERLCALISEQLAFGTYYSEATEKFTKKRVRETKQQVIDSAIKFGIDVNQSIDKILEDLSAFLKL